METRLQHTCLTQIVCVCAVCAAHACAYNLSAPSSKRRTNHHIAQHQRFWDAEPLFSSVRARVRVCARVREGMLSVVDAERCILNRYQRSVITLRGVRCIIINSMRYNTAAMGECVLRMYMYILSTFELNRAVDGTHTCILYKRQACIQPSYTRHV